MTALQEKQLRAALLCGDAGGVRMLINEAEQREISIIKNAVLHEITQRVLAGEMPFCQLVAVCQAAEALYISEQTPIICCGALAGCTSAVTQRLAVMLLHAWGVPTYDLDLNNTADRFITVSQTCGIQFVLCIAFTSDDALLIQEIDRKAREQGVRARIKLFLGGVTPTTMLPVDNTDFRLAVITEEVANTWNR